MKRIKANITYKNEEFFDFDDNVTEEDIFDFIWDYIENTAPLTIDIQWEEVEEKGIK